MTPETLIYFSIVSRESAFSCELIKNMKENIRRLITQSTVSAVDNTVKLSWSMKAKTIFLVDSFSSWNIFSPTEFYFVSVSIRFWWDLNRVPSSIFGQFWRMMKDFSYLLFLDFCLFFIRNREPSTSSVHLEMFRKYLLKRGFLHDIEYLSFDAIGPVFHNTDIHNTSRDSSSRNDNSFPRCWISRKTCASENEFFYGNICESVIFFHENCLVFRG